MTDVPQDRKYTRDHEWVQRDGDRALVGLTDFAQRQLGDVVFVELPEVGKRLESGEPLGTVESVKAVSEVYMPVAGEILDVNPHLTDSPETINEEPYGEGWLVRIRTTGDTASDGLLDAAGYIAYLAEGGTED